MEKIHSCQSTRVSCELGTTWNNMLTETRINQLRVALDLPQTLDGQEVITRLANKNVVRIFLNVRDCDSYLEEIVVNDAARLLARATTMIT